VSRKNVKNFKWSDAKGKKGKPAKGGSHKRHGSDREEERPKNRSGSNDSYGKKSRRGEEHRGSAGSSNRRPDRAGRGAPERGRRRDSFGPQYGDVVRALKGMPKNSGSQSDIEHALRLKSPVQKNDLKKLLDEMVRSGDLARSGHLLQLLPSRTWIGRVSAHPDGFGFVAVDGREEDIFLPPEQMRPLMHGDKVEVRTVRFRGRESGELIQIIEEAPSLITGQFVIRAGLGFVEPRSRKIQQQILVMPKDAGGAKDGDWVQVEIERGSEPLKGRIVRTLHDLLKPSSLIELIMAEQGVPGDFPDAVVKAAKEMPKTVSEMESKNRKDLRKIPFVTIDGADARDFDDAVCVLPRGDGFEVWVAIADVAHYVRPNTAIDIEALERSNSFYFPDRVVPMLPEELSNGLCSLNPHVDRLTMAVRIRYDATGKQRATQVYDAVIHSHARLTYTQAAAWIENGDAGAIHGTLGDDVVRNMLTDARRLLTMLEKNRENRGALGLDLPEVRPVVRDDVIQTLEVSERNVAHRLIEELMLAANVAVAKYFEEHNAALLYRVHPQPEQQALDKLNDFLAPFGTTIHTGKDGHISPKAIQRVLEQSEEKIYGHVLHRLILRSMQQAKYSPNNEGHFGLAYGSYCHFTSPIRRYADLTVHRRLKALVRKQDPNKVQPESGLAAIGEQTSIQERKQQRAEWDVEAMLGALFHAGDVGKRFKAVISGMSKRRFFVEIEDSLAEASVDIEDLGRGYILDEKNHRLVARHGGHMFNLGDEVVVEIQSTDPVRGIINIILVPEEKTEPKTE